MIPRYSRPEMTKVWSDENMYGIWLDIEIAASQAWTTMGVVPQSDMDLIRNATFDRATYDRIFDETKHDLVSFTRAVGESLGAEGRWIHHGLTSNDVKDTALSMQLAQSCDLLDRGVVELLNALRVRAIEFKNTPCIGRSHGIHAEPMSFGMKLALWFAEMKRNRDRLTSARKRVAVGMLSGPVGTFASVPPVIEESVCRQLDLSPAEVSNQVIQRDRHAEYVQVLALIAATLEKMATEIRGLQRTEVREVEEPFGKPGYVTKGSSSMPHKRNPVLSENLTGLARLVRSAVTPALENVALWHERDISHSSVERMIGPDATVTLDFALARLTGMIDKLVVYPEAMARHLDSMGGLHNSQRVLLALTQKGMSREDAYKVVQENAMNAWQGNAAFVNLLKSDHNIAKFMSNNEIESLFDLEYHTKHVDTIFNRVFGEI